MSEKLLRLPGVLRDRVDKSYPVGIEHLVLHASWQRICSPKAIQYAERFPQPIEKRIDVIIKVANVKSLLEMIEKLGQG